MSKVSLMEQNTEEWFSARLGKITASSAHNLLVKGNGQTRKNYILRKASELITGVNQDVDLSSNPYVQRGNALEDEAITMYEAVNLTEVQKVGFFELNKFVGCSPDGLVGDKGLIEIKCKKTENHLNSIIKGRKGIEPKYYTQMQMQMWICDREWCDFVLYHPDFPYKGKYKNLHQIRIEREDGFIEDLKKAIDEAIKEIESIVNGEV